MAADTMHGTEKQRKVQSILGHTAASAMQIILIAMCKPFICLVAFLMVAGLPYARTSLPDSVTISTGESVIFEKGRVFITRSSDKHMIELPALLRRALRNSDEVVFPEATSRHVDGKDVIPPTFLYRGREMRRG
jgi:hypothetical protein